jgi:TPR repeat protein
MGEVGMLHHARHCLFLLAFLLTALSDSVIAGPLDDSPKLGDLADDDRVILPAGDSQGPGKADLPKLETLIFKGKELLKLGDIASARLFFELAAEYGSPVAAKLVGETYDPFFIKEAGNIGLKGDPIQAIEWYKKAATAGDRGAVKNLTRLEGALGQ